MPRIPGAGGLGLGPMTLAQDEPAPCEDVLAESVRESFGFPREDIVAEACKP